MPAIIEHSVSLRYSTWNWPLMITVTDSNMVTRVIPGYWTQRFCYFPTGNFNNYTMLFSNVILTQWNEGFFLREPFEYIVNADAIIIICDDAGVDAKNETQKIADRILQMGGSVNGIFFCITSSDQEEWLNGVVTELAHNLHLPGALYQASESGYFYFDQRMETETTLYAVFMRLKETARLYPFVVSTPEVGEFISADPSALRFDHEHQDAMRLREVNMAVSEIYGRWYNNNNAQWQRMQQRQSAEYREFRNDDYFKEIIREEAALGAEPEPPPYTSRSGPATESPAAPEASPTAPAPIPPAIEQRRLQAEIFASSGQVQKLINSLRPQTGYISEIFIGMNAEGRISGTEFFPEKEIWKDPGATEEILQIVFKENEKIQSAELRLKRTGDSERCRFVLTTGTTDYRAEIFAYHKNRLIQQAVLTAPVTMSDTDSSLQIKLEVSVTIREQLSDLGNRTTFGSSIFLEDGAGKNPTMLGVSEQQPLELYYSQALEKLVCEIRDNIEDAVIDTESYPEDLMHENNMRLLRRLALKGNKLLKNHFKNNVSLKGPLQIITKREEYAPLEFVYTRPAPAEDATICEHAVAALEAGSCRNCFSFEKTPAPHVCPFGFWAFSEVIERHHLSNSDKAKGDYSVRSEPSATRQLLPVLNNTVFACTNRVDAEGKNVIKSELLQAIKMNSVNLFSASDWDQWENMVNTNQADSLVLIVHIEHDDENQVDKLEIENEKFLLQNYLDRARIGFDKSGRPPFIIVIGCESTRIEDYGFDVSTQLMNEGAAIVISNFTRIRGRHAAPVVMKIVEFLRKNTGEEIMVGEILLRVRQYLLSKGIMVSLALVAQGDADWKLKC